MNYSKQQTSTIGIHTPELTTRHFNRLKELTGLLLDDTSWHNDNADSVACDALELTVWFPTVEELPKDDPYFDGYLNFAVQRFESYDMIDFDTVEAVAEFLNAESEALNRKIALNKLGVQILTGENVVVTSADLRTVVGERWNDFLYLPSLADERVERITLSDFFCKKINDGECEITGIFTIELNDIRFEVMVSTPSLCLDYYSEWTATGLTDDMGNPLYFEGEAQRSALDDLVHRGHYKIKKAINNHLRT